MSTPAVPQSESEVLEIKGRSPREIAWSRFKRNKVGVAASIVSITLLSLSLFAPLVCALVGVDPKTLNLDSLDTSGIPRGDAAKYTLQHVYIKWLFTLNQDTDFEKSSPVDIADYYIANRALRDDKMSKEEKAELKANARIEEIGRAHV